MKYPGPPPVERAHRVGVSHLLQHRLQVFFEELS